MTAKFYFNCIIQCVNYVNSKTILNNSSKLLSSHINKSHLLSHYLNFSLRHLKYVLVFLFYPAILLFPPGICKPFFSTQFGPFTFVLFTFFFAINHVMPSFSAIQQCDAEIPSRISKVLNLTTDFLLNQSNLEKPWWEKDEPPADIGFE